MKTTLLIVLFVISTGLVIFSCSKPMPAPVQQDYIHQMLGAHSWAGSENDTVYPVTSPATPGHDTTYNIALNTVITFVNSTTIYLSLSGGGTYNNFQERSFYYLSMNTATTSMLFYSTYTCCGLNIMDTLLYNYAANTMILAQHFDDYVGMYTILMHSP